jgi:transposase
VLATFIKQMTDLLHLTCLAADHIEEDDHSYVITAVNRFPEKMCGNCGSASIRKYGSREQIFNDTPIHGKQVILKVQRQRYRCNQCKKLWHEEIPELSKERRTTKRLQEYVEKRSLKHTFASIADETGIDGKTVRNIFRAYVQRLATEVKFETPRWMGVDEIHIIKKPRAVITNIENNTVVELLPNRKKEALIPYFQGIQDPHTIRYVAIDMWRPYRDAVREVFPHAEVVIGKFHVVKMANEAMEAVRKAVRKELTDKQRRTLMHDRFVLLKRLHNLTDKDRLKFSGWAKNFPLLGAAHALKEGFFAIWDNTARVQAEADYQRWKEGIPQELVAHFSDLVRAVDNWHKEIFNYFDHPITNAYTESLNNLIRVMNRIGRGYSFDALRAKILFTEGVHKEKRKKSRRARMREPDLGGVSMARFMCRTTQDLGNEDQEIRNYGADIATLVRLLEEGEL